LKTQHLKKLKGASKRLSLFEAEMRSENSTGFLQAISGCSAVIHAASPGTDGSTLSTEDVHAAVFGTLAVLRASKAAGVQTVVMTSSARAATSTVGPSLGSESEWADPKQQVQEGKLYDASKTLSEWAAWEFMKKEHAEFKLITILPACIVGPNLSSRISTSWPVCSEDSSDLVNVRDCAAQHIAALRPSVASGRYFSTASLTSIDLLTLRKSARENDFEETHSQQCERVMAMSGYFIQH
jgi:dihydroflavonol-4-reductase